MIGVGISELLLLLFMGGGLGIPVGIPPEKADPLLGKIAPAQCLYYTTWAGMAKPNPASPHPTEQLLADQQVRYLVTQLETQVVKAFAERAERTGDPFAQLLSQFAPKLVKAVLTRPTAIFVSEFKMGPMGPDFRGGLVVNLGESKADVDEALTKFREEVLRQQATAVQIGGSPFHRMQPAPSAPVFTWGIKGNYFMLGVGENAIEGILERAKGEAPAWLRAAENQFAMPRRATLTYADVPAILALATQLSGDPQVEKVIGAIGAGNLTSFVSTTGLDETGVVSRTLIQLNGPPRGLLAHAQGQPLTAKDLAQVPADATAAAVFRLDARRLLASIIDLVAEVDPGDADRINEQLGNLETNLGIKVQDDLLASLGDTWQIYASPRDGGVLTGWTLAISVRDAKKLNEIQQTLMNLLPPQGQVPGAPHVTTVKVGEHTLQTLLIPEMFVSPTWCIANDQFVFGLFPQAVKAHVSRGANEPSLADAPGVAQQLSTNPLSVSYQDTRALFQLVYPLMQIGAQFVTSQMQREGIDLDLTLLPAGSAIGKHLQPSIMMTRFGKAGIEFESHQTFPSGNIGATAPIMAALLLPAVAQARGAAQRTVAVNNLKQIGLAMHNYHDTYRGFPAAYSTNRDGQALLSWRVHILPFIDQTALYEQFHLDEPWDSEHNKKLIPQMPQVYRSPDSMAEPGKTNYLGIRGEQGVMVAPEDDEKGKATPIGTRMNQILDGTSNTIMVVEANDAKAVIWTKPDDLEPDEENPLNGLVGLRPNAFIAAFCDGSVRVMGGAIEAASLNGLFTKDGGEVVNP